MVCIPGPGLVCVQTIFLSGVISSSLGSDLLPWPYEVMMRFPLGRSCAPQGSAKSGRSRSLFVIFQTTFPAGLNCWIRFPLVQLTWMFPFGILIAVKGHDLIL